MSDYFKRMVLVPEGMLNTIQQYQQQQNMLETNNLIRLDNHMETILPDKTRPEDKRGKDFSKFLNRYVTLYDKTNPTHL